MAMTMVTFCLVALWAGFFVLFGYALYEDFLSDKKDESVSKAAGNDLTANGTQQYSLQA